MEGRDEIPDGANVSYLESKLIIQRVQSSGYFQMKRNINANVKLETEKWNKFYFLFTFWNILLNIWIVSFLSLFFNFCSIH